MVSADNMPAALSAVPESQYVDVDVREELRAGKEPFSQIMAARKSLAAEQVLRVRAIFEPVPLYAVFARQGLAHWTEQLASDDWRVWFYAAEADAANAEVSPAGSKATWPAADDVIVLDVRGLEPPEPLLQTMEALKTLPEGGTLVQINERVPQFLLPQLKSRGYSWKIVEEGGAVRVFIQKATETGAA